MPIPHPRRRVSGGHLRHQMGHVRDWAPPGWYWEALPTGGAGWWGAILSLTQTVAVAWASDGPEARGPRGGGASPCQWGGRARPSLLVCVGALVLQYLAGSPGISLELWSRDGSFSVGVHRPHRYPSCARVLVVLVMLYVWYYSGCISDNL